MELLIFYNFNLIHYDFLLNPNEYDPDKPWVIR
jgi:hypothetical protein